jgi:hypothetical protein
MQCATPLYDGRNRTSGGALSALIADRYITDEIVVAEEWASQ